MKKFICLTLILFIASCSNKLPENVKKILINNCDSCHNYKIYKKIKNNNRKKWELILQNMIIKGAHLNENEFNILLNYFSNKK